MTYKISLSSLKKAIHFARFGRNGDANEQTYWPVFKERFPNCELFWRTFVVPTSKRIELKTGEQGGQDRRDGLAEDLWTIGFRHYSLFMQLIYANWHLRLSAPSSFPNFYTHLGSACDLAEDFLLTAYLLILDCKEKKSPILQEMSKHEFLARAGYWYDKNYSKMYDNYHSKGKQAPLHFPPRQDIISEYLGGTSTAWANYKGCARPLREYRNVVVHDHEIGIINTPIGSLVPRKEKIQNYRTFFAIDRVKYNIDKLNSDFILLQEQMVNDFAELQTRLNDLWHRPIEDLRTLLLREHNPKLLAKYNLEILVPTTAGRDA
jgi:hypothetical protein